MILGTQALNEIGKECVMNSDEELFAAYHKLHIHTLKKIRSNNDWLMPFIAQYDQRFLPEIGEVAWLGFIQRIIKEGNLFMTMIPIDNWAFADIDKKENFDNITKPGLKITKPFGNEDAIFELDYPNFHLTRLYQTCEKTPKNPEKMYINNLSGVVEFGTTSISKTAMYLYNNINLIRVPYDPECELLPKPMAMLFHNKGNYDFLLGY